MLSALRQVRYIVILGVAIAVVSWIFLDSWPSGTLSLAWAASFSSRMTDVLAWSLTALCFLIVPGLAAASVTRERELETYQLLRLTLIGPSGLVLSKVTSNIGLFVIMALAFIPLLASLLFSVGVDSAEVGFAFAGIVSMSFMLASVGVYSSLHYDSSNRSISSAYVYGFVLMFLATLITGYLKGPSPAIWHYPGTLILGACFFLIAVFMAWRNKDPKSTQKKPIGDPALLRKRRSSFPFYLIDPLKRISEIPDSKNLIAARELSWVIRPRSASYARAGYLMLAVMGFGSLPALFGGVSDAITGTVIFHVAVVCLFAPALTATSIVSEAESGNLDMMRLATFEPGQIVYGKLQAGLTVASIYMAVSLALLLVIALLSSSRLSSIATVLSGMLFMAVCVTMCLLMGLLASSVASRATGAVVLAYLFSFMALVGFPLALLLVSEILDLRISSGALMFFSPVTFLISWTERPLPQGLFAVMPLFNLAVFGSTLPLWALAARRIFEMRKWREA